MHGGASPAPLPGGAALLADGAAWVLAEDEPERALGTALAWALRRSAATLNVVLGTTGTGRVAGDLARRASLFSLPCQIFEANGRELVRVAPASPESPPGLAPLAAAFAERIAAAGASPVVEYGVLAGEVLGLEVCRVVQKEGGWHLAVGVGRYDRAVHDSLLAGDEGDALDAALARVVASVREHRRAGAGPHPANALAPERWLRAVVVAHPDLAGATFLIPSNPPVKRDDLRQRVPAPAVGQAESGHPLIVACSAGGVDLDLVPLAADVRLSTDPSAALALVIEPAADIPITRDLAAALREPAHVVVVPEDWRGLAA